MEKLKFPTRKVIFFRDKKGKYRWHLIGANGRNIVAESGQGYVKKSECRGMVESIFKYPVIFKE